MTNWLVHMHLWSLLTATTGAVVFLKKRPPMRVLRRENKDTLSLSLSLSKCQCGRFQTVGLYYQEPACDDSIHECRTSNHHEPFDQSWYSTHITFDLGNQKSMSAQSVLCCWTTEDTNFKSTYLFIYTDNTVHIGTIIRQDNTTMLV